jgi:hypothetical protein
MSFVKIELPALAASGTEMYALMEWSTNIFVMLAIDYRCEDSKIFGKLRGDIGAI